MSENINIPYLKKAFQIFIFFVSLVKYGVGEGYSSNYNKEFLGVCASGGWMSDYLW